MIDELEPEAVAISETSELLDLLELTDVYFLRMAVERVDNSDDEDLAEGPRLDHEIFVKHHSRAMSVRLRTSVEAQDAVYEVDVVTDYASGVDFNASEDIRRDFIERVALMAAFPYLRVAVADLSARMRTEHITLGLMRPGDIALENRRSADPLTGESIDEEPLPPKLP